MLDPLDLDPLANDGFDVVDHLSALAATLRAVEPALSTAALRARLRRSVESLLSTQTLANGTFLTHRLELTRFHAEDRNGTQALPSATPASASAYTSSRMGLACLPLRREPRGTVVTPRRRAWRSASRDSGSGGWFAMTQPDAETAAVRVELALVYYVERRRDRLPVTRDAAAHGSSRSVAGPGCNLCSTIAGVVGHLPHFDTLGYLGPG